MTTEARPEQTAILDRPSRPPARDMTSLLDHSQHDRRRGIIVLLRGGARGTTCSAAMAPNTGSRQDLIARHDRANYHPPFHQSRHLSKHHDR